MTNFYQDVFPEAQISSVEQIGQKASDLLMLDFFESEPGEMPYQSYDQHHILLNLRTEPHRVENWRDGEHRDFTYHQNEIIVTPAGVKSGWKWHAKSKVIVITLEPEKLEKFAQAELGILLTNEQLKNIPQFIDADITQAGIMLMQALNSGVGSAVMFESFARIFLVKLIQKYGLERTEELAFTQSFTAKHYKRVLDYVAENFSQNIVLEDMAREAGLSPFHFARLFKQTIGDSPYQFVMSYRVEQAKDMLGKTDLALIEIAQCCGFSDQAHFSRVFKNILAKPQKSGVRANSKNLQKLRKPVQSSVRAVAYIRSRTTQCEGQKNEIFARNCDGLRPVSNNSSGGRHEKGCYL